MTDELEETVARLIRPEVRALEAYAVPDARGLIKLDAMENPYTLPEEVRRAWLEVLRRVELNRYPDAGARALKDRLYSAMEIPRDRGLLLGNGSDELIQIVLLALARPGATVIAPVPTFAMYEMIATAVGMKFTGVPLREDFSLDMPALLKAVKKHKPAAVFLAYPNNPTGNLFSAADIESLLRATPGLVVVDEAYHVFARETFAGRLREFDNLLVMRTLSKLGLAGLRLGLLAGREEWIVEFEKVRLPYNINSLTQASAEFFLANPAFLEEQGERVRADRERLFREIKAIAGIQAWPSRANFILFRVERDAGEVSAALQRAGVLVKNLDHQGGALKGCLRVTVGAPDENAAFLAALRQAV